MERNRNGGAKQRQGRLSLNWFALVVVLLLVLEWPGIEEGADHKHEEEGDQDLVP